MTAAKFKCSSVPAFTRDNVLDIIKTDLDMRLANIRTMAEADEFPIVAKIASQFWELYHLNSTDFYCLTCGLNLCSLGSLETWEMLGSILGNLNDDSVFGFKYTNNLSETVAKGDDLIFVADFTLYRTDDDDPLILHPNEWPPLLDWYIKYVRGQFLHRGKECKEGPLHWMRVIKKKNWKLYPKEFKRAYDHWNKQQKGTK